MGRRKKERKSRKSKLAQKLVAPAPAANYEENKVSRNRTLLRRRYAFYIYRKAGISFLIENDWR